MTTTSPPATMDFAAIYEAHFADVCRWVRALGGPEADIEDLAQEVFLVAQRKLDRFNGENVAAWLYAIARRVTGSARRRAWFRHLVAGRGEVSLEDIAQSSAGPAELLERREGRLVLHSLLARLSAKRRAVFILYEIEGLSGEAIAALEGIKTASVWTRLHHARRDFLTLVEKRLKQEQRERRPKG